MIINYGVTVKRERYKIMGIENDMLTHSVRDAHS